ncbi:MAG: hypothetical protein ACLQE9_23300 [Roseiarcus sp.]
MQSRTLANVALAALAGAAMLTVSMGPASAFTLSSPSLEQSVASSQVDKVWWRRWGGYGWRGYGWRGYGYPYGYGYHCWRGYYGYLHCN